MLVFEIVIGLLITGVVLTALARKIRTPYPALMAFAGAALALVPGTPTIVLDPSLALALFVAPVLLDAAFDSSQRDLRANWRTVTSLALGAVVLTVIVVAFVVHTLVPGLPWAAAIALGAIVAPPDAAAATAVLKQLRPPHRLLVVLEGESLFNDASALLIYRAAVAATITGFISGWRVVPMMLFVTIGSLVLGLVLSRVIVLANNLVAQDVGTAVVMQFCGTFAVWMLAERLHLSGILTMVVFAMAVSRRSQGMTPARIRIPSYAVWEVAVFVLNVLAFILVGFQLKGILTRIDRGTLSNYAWIAAAVCLATIVARMVWVTAAAEVSRWWCRPRRKGRPRVDAVSLSRRGAVAIGWCGMRGTVTLAAALALPGGATPFPYRDLIVFTSFSVVLGTLVVQGMTLRPLMSKLALHDDGQVEHEAERARVETTRAALAAIEHGPGGETAALVQQRYELLLRRAEACVDGPGNAATQARAAEDDAVVRAANTAQRDKLIALRADGTIGDAAFQLVEQELDWEEMDLQQLLRTEEQS
jgi:Na+/H+ antiporter